VEEETKSKGCAIIPAYREGGRIGPVVSEVLKYMPHVIVVDDGSPDNTSSEAEQAGAIVIRHEVNRGKGAALDTGFRAARERGYDFVVTMDGDGQHAAADVPCFIEAYTRTAVPVWVGSRMSDTKTMPFVRRMTNRFMSWLLSREMGQRVPDTQCGFRLYKVDVVPELPLESARFAAESEILMELSHKGVKIGSISIATIYGSEKSKIHPVKDTVRFIKMLRQYRKRHKRHKV